MCIEEWTGQKTKQEETSGKATTTAQPTSRRLKVSDADCVDINFFQKINEHIFPKVLNFVPSDDTWVFEGGEYLKVIYSVLYHRSSQCFSQCCFYKVVNHRMCLCGPLSVDSDRTQETSSQYFVSLGNKADASGKVMWCLEFGTVKTGWSTDGYLVSMQWWRWGWSIQILYWSCTICGNTQCKKMSPRLFYDYKLHISSAYYYWCMFNWVLLLSLD